MKIIDEIKKIEKHNKYAANFYEYDGWYIDEIMLDMAWNGRNKKVDINPIKKKLKEILSYCALRELNRFYFDSISEGYYNTIQDTCGAFDTRKKLDELYEELEIEDPYKEKEPEDDYDRYEHEWEREIKSELR